VSRRHLPFFFLHFLDFSRCVLRFHFSDSITVDAFFPFPRLNGVPSPRPLKDRDSANSGCLLHYGLSYLCSCLISRSCNSSSLLTVSFPEHSLQSCGPRPHHRPHVLRNVPLRCLLQCSVLLLPLLIPETPPDIGLFPTMKPLCNFLPSVISSLVYVFFAGALSPPSSLERARPNSAPIIRSSSADPRLPSFPSSYFFFTHMSSQALLNSPPRLDLFFSHRHSTSYSPQLSFVSMTLLSFPRQHIESWYVPALFHLHRK